MRNCCVLCIPEEIVLQIVSVVHEDGLHLRTFPALAAKEGKQGGGRWDELWLATGTEVDVASDPLLTQAMEQYPIQAFGFSNFSLQLPCNILHSNLLSL